MAAKLRVANGPSCVEARNQLADLVASGPAVSRERVQAQQAFVDEYCTSPVR
jgi:predicted secreted Zn-dependent protease